MDQTTPTATVTRCTAGRDPQRCCVGDPWKDYSVFEAEPLDQAVIGVAAAERVDPHALDEHVTAVHGWEAHDVGYDRAVAQAAVCLAAGGPCE